MSDEASEFQKADSLFRKLKDIFYSGGITRWDILAALEEAENASASHGPEDSEYWKGWIERHSHLQYPQ